MSGNSALYDQAMRDGHALSWQMRWEAAVERYEGAVAEFPSDVAALSSLATALYKVGRVDAALDRYQALLTLTPDDEAALSRVAEIHYRRGDARQATAAYLALASYYLRSGQRPKATQTWVKLAELVPEDLETHEQLYLAVSKAGDSVLASKVGLTITRLRGEQSSRGIDRRGPSGGPRDSGGGESDATATNTGPLDPKVLDAAMREAEKARAHLNAGRLREALLGYATAAAPLARAGASREVAELAGEAAPLAAKYGGLPFLDLLALDEEARAKVVDVMAASRLQIDGGLTTVAIDQCLAGIAIAPQYLPLQERLAEAQACYGALHQAASTYISLSETYALLGQGSSVDAALAKAAQLSATDKQTWQRLVAALLAAGLHEQAVAQVLALSERMLEDGELEEAARLLEQAVAAVPNEPNVLVRWGQALEGLGELGKALQAYQQAVSSDRDHFEAALGLTLVGSLLGAFDTVESAQGVVLDGIVEGGEKRTEALRAYEATLHQNADSLELRLCYGAALGAAGDWQAGLPHLEQATGGEARVAATARLLLGRYSLECDTPEAAVRQLAVVQRLIVEQQPSERAYWRRTVVEFQRLWGEVCLRRGELDKASAAFKEVQRLAPRDKNVYTQLAEVHFQRGDLAAVGAVLVTLGDLHQAEGQMARAATAYYGAVQVAPDDPTPQSRLAEAYRSLNRHEEAFAAMSDLADTLARQGKAEEAAAVLRQMVEQSRPSDPTLALTLRERITRLVPDDGEARQQLIAAYLAGGNADAAVDEAMRLWHDMLRVNRLAEASAALQQVLRIDPWNGEALVGLGEIYELMGEHASALEVYRHAQAIDAENERAAARIAALAPLGGNPE